MKAIRIPLIVAILFAMSSCALAPVHTPPVVVDGESAGIGIRLYSANPSSQSTVIEFHIPPDYKYTHFVQEVTLDSGEQLVECFRCDYHFIYDYHSWPTRPHWRTMTVYAANVEGCDEWNGWGHLPDNGAGFETTVGKGFNAPYQQNYETRGRIISRSPVSFTWRIDDDGREVIVSLPSQ